MTIQRQSETEGNSGIGTANVLTFAGGATRGLAGFVGDLPAGDLDCVGVFVAAGDVLTLRTTSGFDPVPRVRDGGGTQLAANDDSGDQAPSLIDRQSFLQYVAPVAGNHFVEVSSFAGQAGAEYVVWVNVDSKLDTVTAAGDALAAANVGAPQQTLLFGAGGSEAMSGSPVNGVLEGGTGNDSLSGGLGDDLAVFADARANATITQTGPAAWTVSGDLGTDLLTSIEGLQFRDSLVRPLALQLRSQDFGGDGRSDILGRGQAGSAPVWHIDGAAVLPTSTAVAAPGAYWALA
jgi:Bacterial pre-peptidase C-terminal domain